MAGRIALRSFQDTNTKLLLIRCTIQVCTVVCGNTDVIASGKPRAALRNVGKVMESGGTRFIVGYVLETSRLKPAVAVGLNLSFISIYDDGQAYTEQEHRTWLAEAGFKGIDVQYGAALGGASIL